jgi:hypothetical protein
MAALHENRSRSALRSTLAKGVPLRAGFWLGNCYGDESQESSRNWGRNTRRGWPSRTGVSARNWAMFISPGHSKALKQQYFFIVDLSSLNVLIRAKGRPPALAVQTDSRSERRR